MSAEFPRFPTHSEFAVLPRDGQVALARAYLRDALEHENPDGAGFSMRVESGLRLAAYVAGFGDAPWWWVES